MTNPVISIDPLPPVHGRPATISYTGKVGTVLHLDWNPAGTPTSVTIGRDGKAVLTVPANATSLVIVDPTGGASPLSTPVN